jgi:hypothetical protein
MVFRSAALLAIAVVPHARANMYDVIEKYKPGRKRKGVQGSHLNPLGLFLHTSIPFI